MINAYTKLNLGDDLFIKILCERYPQTRFYLYAPKEYKRLFKKVRNLTIFPNNIFIVRAINYLLRTLKINDMFFRSFLGDKCDAAVYIGGSLFMQNKNWKSQVRNLKQIKLKRKPFYLLGANFGPYTDDEFYEIHNNIFREYTDICFRDSYSYKLFQKLPNVRMADDIIFQLNYKIPRRDAKIKRIAISVIKPSLRPHLSQLDNIYYEKLKDIIIYFCEKGYHIDLMSFCEGEGDGQAIAEIKKILPEKYLNMVRDHYYKYNIEESINTIANSDFVIATRFHSMVLGWLFNKPVFPIVYSKKMTNVMNDVGFKGSYTELNSFEHVKAEEIYNSIETNIIDVSKQVENSVNHFKELDKLLLDK